MEVEGEAGNKRNGSLDRVEGRKGKVFMGKKRGKCEGKLKKMTEITLACNHT